MPAGDVPDRVGHRQDGQAERECHADEPDAQLREGRRKHCAAATAEDQPERSQEFGDKAPLHIVVHARFPSAFR